MKGYRTYIVAALIAASGVLATTDWLAFMSNPQAGLVALGSALAMALMRSITNTPPGNINLPGAATGLGLFSVLVLTGAGGLLSGCANLTSQQRADLQLQLTLAKQIGADAVQIWCASSNVVYVVANDLNAQARVTTALGKNAKAATDACPMIAQVSGVQVVTTAQARALTQAGG